MFSKNPQNWMFLRSFVSMLNDGGGSPVDLLSDIVNCKHQSVEKGHETSLNFRQNNLVV